MLLSFAGRRLAVLFSCLAVGCGSAPDRAAAGGADAATTTPAEPTFVVSGGSFDKLAAAPFGAVAFLEPISAEGAGPSGVKTRLHIMASDHPSDLCAAPMHASSSIYTFEALSEHESFQPGTFTQKWDFVPGQVLTTASTLGPSCDVTAGYTGTEATVVVTEVTETSVTGTFELTFSDGAGTLKGSFKAPICAWPPKYCQL